MRSAVSSCAVSSHMYVVTGSSVLSLDESMYLQRTRDIAVRWRCGDAALLVGGLFRLHDA